MMKFVFKHMLLAYLALGLVAAPLEAMAAQKKSSKRQVFNQKNTSSQKHASTKLSLNQKNALEKLFNTYPDSKANFWAVVDFNLSSSVERLFIFRHYKPRQQRHTHSTCRMYPYQS